MNKIKRLVINLKRLRQFFFDLKLEPVHLYFPSLLAVLAAVFEAMAFVLLVPTIRGLIESNYTFVYSIKGLGYILRAFPSIFEGSNASIFVLLTVLILMCSLLKNTFSYLSSIQIMNQARRFTHNLRCMIFNSYLGFKKSYFDKKSVGDLQNVLIGYTQQIAMQCGSLHAGLFHCFVIIAYLAVMVTLSWKVTLFVLFLFPVLMVIFKKLVIQIKSSSEEFANQFSLLGKRISNSLACMTLIKASGSEDVEKKWFAGVSNRVTRCQYSMDKRSLIFGPLQEVFLLFCLMVLAAFIAFLAIKNKEGSLSAYMVLIVVMRRAMASMSVLASLQGRLAQIVGPLKKVLQIFENKRDWSEVSGGHIIKQFENKIEFQNLSFKYVDRSILNGVSFDVVRGKTVAIVGKTGSGKTTLIQLLLRFYNPPKGSIFIDGHDICDLQIKSWRNQIAYVSQDNYFFDATIEENVRYGCGDDITQDDVSNALEQVNLSDFIKKLPDGVATIIGERGVKLSGGEKQRLALARAILRKSKILILDEATSAMDSHTEELVQSAILKVSKDRTAVVIAHRLATIQNADLILVLDEGKIVEKGSFHELTSQKGIFSTMWEQQMLKKKGL